MQPVIIVEKPVLIRTGKYKDGFDPGLDNPA